MGFDLLTVFIEKGAGLDGDFEIDFCVLDNDFLGCKCCRAIKVDFFSFDGSSFWSLDSGFPRFKLVYREKFKSIQFQI